MGRGRRPNMALEPTRALQTQRAFRQRKADYLAGLQDTIDQLTKENNRFRQLLRLEPRPEIEQQQQQQQSRERSMSSRLPSEPVTGSHEDEEPSVQETKQQLAIAATHVEQQVAGLYQTLKVLRSLIESKSTSADLLHGATSLAELSNVNALDDRRVAKKARTSHGYGPGDEDGATYASSPTGIDRASSIINGVSMTSNVQSHSPPVTATDRASRHLPPPHVYSQNGVSGSTTRSPLQQAASAPPTMRTASWHSPSGSVASPAANNRDSHIINGRHHHAVQQSASRTPLSPMEMPAYASPKHQAHSPSNYPNLMKSEPYYSHIQQPQYHQQHHQQHHPQQHHPQQQQPPSHYAPYSSPYPTSNSEAGSYSATRSLALQALNSPHGRHGYATNECDAGPSPATSSTAVPTATTSSTSSHQSGSASSATSTLDNSAPAANGKGGKKACCPPKSTEQAPEHTQPPPLGISVDMKTQMPNGEPCCFGLVECDDQGRIII